MTTTIDQNIWIERVNKEKAVQQKFGFASLINGKTGGSCSNIGVVRQFIRDGQPPQVVKHRPYYMVDSSYTVASDPNSMRDSGYLRNARYIVIDDADREARKMKRDAKAMIKEMQSVKEAMLKRCPHVRPPSAQNLLRKTFDQRKPDPAYQVPSQTCVTSNDYTKNISSMIFSPSLKERPMTAISRSRMSKPISGHQALGKDTAAFHATAKPLRSYKEIERDINSEKARRNRLEQEVRELKEQMSTIQASVRSSK